MGKARSACLVFLASCFLAAPSSQARSPKVELEIPFHRPGLGIGGGVLLASLELAPGSERRQLSRYIVEGLQTLGHSLEGEGVDLFEIPEKSWIETDIVPLDDAGVEAYNEAAANLALTQDRLYGLAYEFRYQVEEREIVFVVRCRLYARGARSSRWHEHRGDYDAQFFVARFKDSIHQADHAARGLDDPPQDADESVSSQRSEASGEEVAADAPSAPEGGA